VDKFLEEQVPNKEGEEFANKIGGFFKATSAATSAGIIDLFKELGKRYLDPNYRIFIEKESKESFNNKDRSKSVKLNEAKNKENKKIWWC